MNTENIIRKMIKNLLSDCDTTLTEVVVEMNRRHPENPTTPQNLTNKLARQTIRFREVIEIADIVGCEVKFVKKQKLSVMDRKDAVKILDYLKKAKEIIDSYDDSDDIRMDKPIADDCLDCLSAIEYCINNS